MAYSGKVWAFPEFQKDFLLKVVGTTQVDL